jgi:hypothetical protein
MLSSRWRGPITIVFLVGVASAGHGQVQLTQILFQPDYTRSQQLAKSSGLPLMVVVLAMGDTPSGPLIDPDVVRRSRAFLNVAIPARGNVSRKLNGVAGSVLFLDGEGKVLARLDPGCGVEQLRGTMASVTEEARTRALQRVKNGTAQLVALKSYVQLGATVADLIPLLAHRNPGVSSAVRKVLATRKEEGADWALLKAMASPDAEIRAASYAAALEAARAPKVPPVSFWKEAPADDRAAALEKWREAVYGKLPPVNKAILDFAFENYGKQVDNGLCGMLIIRALQAAGGRLPRFENNIPTYGRRLALGETALPGDIVILENARFRGVRYEAFAPSHAQIVRRALGPGQYEILEQNHNGRRTVGSAALILKDLTQGTVVFYRPLAAGGDAGSQAGQPVAAANPEEDRKGLADALVNAEGAKRKSLLDAYQKGKGSHFSFALAAAIPRLEGQARAQAREALADRLTRMTASTLRNYLQDDAPELRSAAALACAAKEDKSLMPELIALLIDQDKRVPRAALASLKALTGQDLGPSPDATPEERIAAVERWRDWWKRNQPR